MADDGSCSLSMADDGSFSLSMGDDESSCLLMADDGPTSQSLRREPLKSTSVGVVAGQRRRQLAVTIGKEKREALVRTKRLCRVGIDDDNDNPVDSEMMIQEEQSILDAQTSLAVEELKSSVSYKGKGALQRTVSSLTNLRQLLSKSEFPPVESALKAGALLLLVQCLSFGSPDEQLLEAAWCLTNIAAGKPEETNTLLPAIPLLIAHLGEKSSLAVAEQCAWALGNVAGESEDLRNILLVQGALNSLGKMLLRNKGSSVRTAAWALSNLVKGPDSKAATKLIKVDGVRDAIVRHMKNTDEELVTEVAWVVVYLSALSDVATSLLVKTDLIPLLVQRLANSNNLPMLIPIVRSLGNFVAGDPYTTSVILCPGRPITDVFLAALAKCLKYEYRVLKKEAAWVLSNLAAGSVEYKRQICSSETLQLLLRLLSTAPFDIRKEVMYVLGNLCVFPSEGSGRPELILEHLILLVSRGCLPSFIDLLKRSADAEAARLCLQFIELVLRGMPNNEGPKLVERENGIEAMERFQFHENEDLRNMSNGLVDRYFGAGYGFDD